MSRALTIHSYFLSLILLFSCTDDDQKVTKSEYYEMKIQIKTEVGGILGEAIRANREGRLKAFIQDENSAPIQLFNRDSVMKATEPNWRGEHAGKWMYTTARAAWQSGDEELKHALFQVADYLVSQQEEDGYLGTYAPEIRMTQQSGRNIKSWDIWVHGYLMEGFLEINKYFPNPLYVNAAKKIGDLCIDTFGAGRKSLAHISYHAGMVGTGIMGPMMELYWTTGDERYLAFAKYAMKEVEDRAGLELISRANRDMDVSLIGNGKIYEMMRLCVGLAKLYREDPQPEIREALLNIWESVRQKHLYPTGGPWGGIDKHLECFNREFVFSPYGYNETCATMDWFRFNVQLLKITSQAKFAEELEKTAYNAILGAQFPDGEHWVYHSHTNGIRNSCGEWACCSSSGTLVLEELPPVIYRMSMKGLKVNLYTPSESSIELWNGKKVRISQETDYPFGSKVDIFVETDHPAYCCLRVRIPSWAENPEIKVDGVQVSDDIRPGEYYSLERRWKEQAHVELIFPIPFRTVTRSKEFNEQGHYLDTKTNYAAFAKGPLVYAAEYQDTRKTPASLTLPGNVNVVELLNDVDDSSQQKYRLAFEQDTALVLQPYYAIGDRGDGIYRMTWFELSDN